MNLTEDKSINWKWGIFYVNRADARIFIPKRFGIGWTLNFAKPIVYLLLAVPFIIFFIAVALKR